jgi:hypothetical protein
MGNNEFFPTTYFSIDKLINLFAFILIGGVIIDPANLIFHLKYYVFIILLVLFFIKTIVIKAEILYPTKFLLYVFTLSILFPFYGLIISLITPQVITPEPFKYIPAYFFLFFALITYQSENYIKNIVLFFLYIICFIIVALKILVFTNQTYLLEYIANRFPTFVITERIYGSIHYIGIDYLSSPLLSYALSYTCFLFFTKKKTRYLILMLFVFIAMLATGTRNNILFAFVLPLIIYFYNKSQMTLAIFSLICIAIILYFTLPSLYSHMFNLHEASNSLKLSYISSYINTFLSNWQHLLLGSGIGSFIWIPLLNKFVSITELTYCEIIRVYGVIFGFTLIMFFIMPIFALRKIKTTDANALSFGYIIFLIMNITDPYLFSSTGFVFLSLILIYIYSPKAISRD